MDLDSSRPPGDLAVLVVGTDTVIEALPARPIQLAHACSELGFDLVVPLSWGDELVAAETVRGLASRGPAPAVFCACPHVRDRLLATGTDLLPSILALVPPPIAVARHVRSLFGRRLHRLVFAGACPEARLAEFDASITPPDLFKLFRDKGITVEDQPDAFIDRIPPDRRRFISLPGGCPTSESLWRECNERVLVELEENDLAVEIAQRLLTPQPVLVDAAAALHCSCSGVTSFTTGRSARIAVSSLEPPRADSPVVDAAVPIPLSMDLAPPTGGADSTLPSLRAPRAPMAVTPPGAFQVK